VISVWQLGHFSFQCSFTLEESLVFSTIIEVLEYLVYKGVHDLLLKEPIISESSDSMLHITLAMLPTIESYFCECLSKNALVIKSKARCKTIVPEDNHL
jgi:hypothetical protein